MKKELTNKFLETRKTHRENRSKKTLHQLLKADKECLDSGLFDKELNQIPKGIRSFTSYLFYFEPILNENY